MVRSRIAGDPDLQYLSKHPAIFGITKVSCDDLKNNVPFNFVGLQMPTPGWNSQVNVAAFSGTINFNNTTSQYDVTVKNYKLDGTEVETFSVSGDCADDVISFDVGASEKARLSFTPSGMFFLDDPSQGGAVGFKSDSSVAINEVYGKTVIGMRYHPNYEGVERSPHPETQPWKGTIAQDGTSINVDFFKDIAKGETVSFYDVPILFGTEIVSGMFKGKVDDEDGTHDAIYLARKVNGNYQVIFVTDNWPSHKGWISFMIQK